MRKSFFMASAALGAMTAAERAKGRYMRSPDGHDDAEFAAFEAAGDVQVGESNIEANKAEDTKPKRTGRGPKEPKTDAKPAAKEAAAKAAGQGEPGEDEDVKAAASEDDDEDDDEEEEEKPKPRKKASERIRELNARGKQQQRLIEQLSSRLDSFEKGGLPTTQGGDKSSGNTEKAPDPSDTAKYPLGHLDDRYIEDRLQWLVKDTATRQADAVLQRQQEQERTAQAQQAHSALLEKVDALSDRGSEIHDDYHEVVIEAGMKGEWKLDQPTFEAAHEAEHGAQILYDLSQDKKEAARVAKLSPFGQAKYVLEKDAEIAAKSKPRTVPGAGAPPTTQSRGANSKIKGNPATDDLNDFEKQWAADEKGK